jgi:DNA-binding HxlR family transcriptional regulator
MPALLLLAFRNWLPIYLTGCKMQAVSQPRSYCPINLSLEIFGDAWTLLVLRDLMFGGKRHFRELLQSDEGISTNILAERLARLVEHGLLTKADDPTHKQKAIYSLTEKAIALLPVVVQIGAWGARWVPDAKKLDKVSRKFLRELQQGGPRMWAKRMDELRAQHLR